MKINFTRKILSFTVIFVLIIVIFLFTLDFSVKADTAWLSNWLYRKQFTVTNPSADYQIRVLVGESSGASGEEVDCNSHVKTDFSDLRFTGADEETLLDYWIESISGTTPNQLATVWVQNNATPDTTLYMYYGNTGASSASNGANTFIKFEDFEDFDNGDGVDDDKGTINWTVSSGVCIASTDHAFGGTNSMKLAGGSPIPSCQFSHTAGSDYAIRFRFWKESGTTSGYPHYFPLHGNSSYRTNAYVLQDNNVYYYDTAQRSTGGSVDADAWTLVELNDFNWSSHHFDIWTRGSEIKANAGMYATGLTQDLVLWLHGDGAGKDLYIDDIIIRKWAATEPSFGSWGSEEKAPFEMASDTYHIWSSSINVGGLDSQTSTNYKMKETIGELAIGTVTSTSYKLKMGYQPMLDSYISLSVSTSSLEMLPTISTIAGGVATSSYSATVITDNVGGYSLYVEANTDPALQSGGNNFVDYLPATENTPDFSWLVAATTSGFGFTPEGDGVAQKFLDNGADTCATSSSNTADACWYGFSTSAETVTTVLLPNVPSGTETTIKLKAESGSENTQTAGTYQAIITTSAIAL